MRHRSRHANGDAEIRRLERALAADPSDEQAREALARAQIRAGLRPPARKYLADLVLEMVRAGEIPGETRLSSTAVSRKGYAVGIRAVLKKAKLSKFVTVSVPNYSMARSVEIQPTAAGADPVARGRMDAQVAADVAAVFGVREAGSPQYISLYVWAQDDRSDPHSDYFAPGGPLLLEDFWEEFKAGVRRSFAGKRSNNPRRHPNYTQTDPHDPAALIDLALSYVEKPRPNVAKAREAMEAVYGGHPDLEEVARSWVARAQQGDPRAVIVLGWLAEFEIGFDLEAADADELFDRAIELGWPWATTSLLV